MRLVVKRNSNVVHEFEFLEGPINIGRHADSQIFLSDRTVSRHHAVIYSARSGQWLLEDLDSTNKTFLNGKEIHKTEIQSGDEIRITNFNIEINLENDTIMDKPINLEDTLATSIPSPEDTASPLDARMVIRRIETGHSPDIRMPIKRAKDFSQATEAICKANTPEEMLKILINIAIKQFNAYHTWCALRNQPQGDMDCHAGKKRGGGKVDFDKIKLKDKITKAVEKKQFLLFPRIPPAREKEKIHSAMIAPIIGSGGCFGVLYLDNDMSHEHYTLNDLDYLILLVIHISVILENF